MPLAPLAPCPCGRLASAVAGAPAGRGRVRAGAPLAFADCCGRYLDPLRGGPAPDAESLMRSRYTAFVLEDGPYLLATWAPAQRPASIDFDPGTRWLGLEVRAHRSTGAGRAEVEFVARQRDAGGRAHRLHETSRFVHAEGRWFYVDGDLR
ncbi:YchJ family metal-binding protein [Acidovorax sp. FG27]|uniref:YchJ family protein n=1 Tax=Acidovorax sp. FG27 TaxID=3133652 RepID=UPI00334251A1